MLLLEDGTVLSAGRSSFKGGVTLLVPPHQCVNACGVSCDAGHCALLPGWQRDAVGTAGNWSAELGTSLSAPAWLHAGTTEPSLGLPHPRQLFHLLLFGELKLILSLMPGWSRNVRVLMSRWRFSQVRRQTLCHPAEKALQSFQVHYALLTVYL